jgi:hypothetical protein
MQRSVAISPAISSALKGVRMKTASSVSTKPAATTVKAAAGCSTIHV